MVRTKHRYLLTNILFPFQSPLLQSSGQSIPDTVIFNQPCPSSFTTQILTRTIRRAVEHTFGDYGASAIGNTLRVIYFSPATSTAIIRIAREHWRLLWASLTLLTSIPAGEKKVDPQLPCVVRVLRVSGTIRKAEEEAIKRAKELMQRARDDNAAVSVSAGGAGNHVWLSQLLGGEERDDKEENTKAGGNVVDESGSDSDHDSLNDAMEVDN